MEEDVYEEVITDNEQQDYPRSEEFSYYVNECYELESYRQQKNTQYHAFQESGLGSGKRVHPVSKKADLHIQRIKRYLIALSCVIVLLALVAITAFLFGTIQSSHLTDKVNFLSSQLNQKTQESETWLTNKDSMISDNISQVLNNLNTVKNAISSLQEQIYCGAGQWNRIAFFNMSDPSQQCPSAWRLVTTNGVRACGRPVSSRSTCPGTFFSTVTEYNKVCGRVIGYQNKTPDGFYGQNNINNAYMDGVSITVTNYAGTRIHVWSYVAGATERSTSFPKSRSNCPCSTAAGTRPPSFVNNNYYCESANPTDLAQSFYLADKLWDGKDCEGTCCSGSKSPPWFSVHLPNPTTESIEVRICSNESTDNEDTPIELLEIYVQ